MFVEFLLKLDCSYDSSWLFFEFCCGTEYSTTSNIEGITVAIVDRNGVSCSSCSSSVWELKLVSRDVKRSFDSQSRLFIGCIFEIWSFIYNETVA